MEVLNLVPDGIKEEQGFFGRLQPWTDGDHAIYPARTDNNANSHIRSPLLIEDENDSRARLAHDGP